MRRATLGLAGILLAACSATPSASPVPTATTETIGRLVVAHPPAWRLVRGPPAPADGRAVPSFYLMTEPIANVIACPTIADDGTYAGCPQPIDALSAGGLFVTVSPNLGLMEPAPPVTNVIETTAACRSIGGERSLFATAAGMVVEACLRGPRLDQAEAQVRAFVLSLRSAG
jgi:hypothetical protein